MTTELKKAIEIVKEYLDMDSDVDSEYLNAQRTIIEALESQPTDAKQDCEHCIHTYGTLGCCDMVNNEWVYDCDFGKEQYKKEHEAQSTDAVSREAVLNTEYQIKNINDIEYVMLSEVQMKMRKLPSVTPQIESCDDCISRAEAINVVHKYFIDYLKLNDDICLDGIRSLSSVTPRTNLAETSQDCISILNRIMEYTYGMLTAEKIGLQHLIKSMMDELSGGDSE